MNNSNSQGNKCACSTWPATQTNASCGFKSENTTTLPSKRTEQHCDVMVMPSHAARTTNQPPHLPADGSTPYKVAHFLLNCL
eukprot:1138522-Pelagomonas_calceolata.AAC.2